VPLSISGRSFTISFEKIIRIIDTYFLMPHRI
jgi:hypothetical protein